jgi:hypothetical protein
MVKTVSHSEHIVWPIKVAVCGSLSGRLEDLLIEDFVAGQVSGRTIGRWYLAFRSHPVSDKALRRMATGMMPLIVDLE